MATAPKLGGKVRGLRRREKLTQVELAGRLGISPSYLNLIEHNQRPLPSAVLLKLAQLFHLDLAAFAEDHEGRLAEDLSEVFGDALFEESDLTTQDVRELAANPGAARAVVALYRAYRNANESALALAARVSDGGDLHGLDPSHLPSEEVSDLLQENGNFFPDLEETAERLAAAARVTSEDFPVRLAAWLRETHGIAVEIVPADRHTALRRLDAEAKRLEISEVLPPRSRNFQLAQQAGLLFAAPEIDAIVSRARLSTAESAALARVALAAYFAGALLMPYEAFLAAAKSLRYDIELLGHRFRTSFEQVSHRLTTLRKPGREGVPFHMIRVDVAGNISKRFSASGIRFARFSGLCPRWNVHSVFMTPGTIRAQLSRMPDGRTYFCLARTIRKGTGGHGAPHTLQAIGLGCDVSHARELVYSDGLDVDNVSAAVPIGVSCRICPRLDCEQRAFPPIQKKLSVDENVRGFSFYASADETPGG